MKKMKRNSILVSIGLVVAIAIYVFSQYMGGPLTSVASAIPSRQIQPTTKPTLGLYANGTYTGSSANAYYGTVQVQAVVQNGKLANVQFLQYPSDRSTSRYINGQAMPILQSEAIQVQSSNVNTVSGATFTSQAFQQSLSSALSQAQA